MVNISLEAAVRTCKVSTGWAPRIQSERFQDTKNLLCPTWNNVDTIGRNVCPDSFYTKREGCNSPLERITIENNNRPRYFGYITLNAEGMSGGIEEQKAGVENFRPGMEQDYQHYIHQTQHRGGHNVENYVLGAENTVGEVNSTCRYKDLQNVHNITGQFGMVSHFGQYIENNSGPHQYEDAMQKQAELNRYNQGVAQGESANNVRQ